MNFSPSALIEHARSAEGRKQLRYAGISIVFVPVGQILIQVMGRLFFLEQNTASFIRDHPGHLTDPNFTKASIASAAILTLPNFFANKYLVWRDTNKDNLRTQIVVFWVAAMLGVALATALTYWAESVVKHADVSSLVESIAVFFAQLVGFGIIWVARYLVLDKWLFKVTHHGEEPTDAEVAELHHDFPI